MAVTDLSSENYFIKIKESFGKFVVRPSQLFGLSGLVFDIDGKQENKLQADITDHYVEDNSAIQDHIARKPIEITLNSYIGELVKKDNNSIKNTIQKTIQKLSVLSSFAPVLQSAASKVKGLASGESLSFDSTVSTASDLWSLTKNLNPSASSQQKAYLFFKSLYEQNVLLSLQTPWEYLTNMAIKQIIATQEEGTNQISSFSITLKKINTASTQTKSFDKNKHQGRGKQQKQSITSKGIAKGVESLLSKAKSYFIGK